MDTDHRPPRVQRDRVRVFDSGGRRATVGRVLAAVLAIAVIVMLGARVMPVFRGDSGAPLPQEVASAPVRADPVPTEAAPSAAPSAAPHAVRKFPAPAVDRDRVAARDRTARRPRPAPTTAPAAAPAPDPVRDASGSEAAETEHSRIERVARGVIDRLRASGETRGLAAFPPPGTSPIKTGLVVPENFELPEGYVRHYQTTDDGQRLEAILMFSPDYQFVDANGRSITLPDDGIVPVEMAPPGLPLRTLQLPRDTRTPGASAEGR